ncbi:MAG: class flavin-dependent oxidoreductase, partial [Cellulosimicrobium sp.]|nr:class flavin-dependent oxidoreductase [Cellulosimicrobium sp.]
MRFQVLDIVFNPPHPVTGEAVAPSDRLNRVVKTAVLAEELGFDSFAVGERHAGEVLSSAPTVILGAVAARTSRILLSTGVTVLSLLDPIRVAEDLATVDQLSRGRLEIVIGKGTEVLQYPLLGLDIDKQYEYLQENYELLRLLLSEEDVSWSGRHRHALEHATTLPRPFAGPFRIWHGSATSQFAVELAARYGD